MERRFIMAAIFFFRHCHFVVGQRRWMQIYFFLFFLNKLNFYESIRIRTSKIKLVLSETLAGNGFRTVLSTVDFKSLGFGLTEKSSKNKTQRSNHRLKTCTNNSISTITLSFIKCQFISNNSNSIRKITYQRLLIIPG